MLRSLVRKQDRADVQLTVARSLAVFFLLSEMKSLPENRALTDAALNRMKQQTLAGVIRDMNRALELGELGGGTAAGGS